MKETVFRVAALTPRSFFQKIFKQHPEGNAVIELNNLLASTNLRDIQKEQVQAIEHKYNLDLQREFRLNLEEFYAVYLAYCLKDRQLSPREHSELQHLKAILNLNDKSIGAIHEKIGAIVYKKSFEEAVSDGKLSDEENEFLLKLERELRLPKEIAEKISAEARGSFVQQYVDRIITDGRLSPDEEKELETIAGNLRISLQLDEKNRKQLEKLKLYWALENLPLPTIETDITLQKNEECYLDLSHVEWNELRSVKGLKLIDRGTLYLTDKRIIFDSGQKKSMIRLEKIVGIVRHEYGVEIHKDAGKTPFLKMAKGCDIFCIVLERLLREK
jgi:hypothetical protein